MEYLVSKSIIIFIIKYLVIIIPTYNNIGIILIGIKAFYVISLNRV